MNFLVDAQLPRRLAHCLTARGHDAIHTLDLPRGNTTHDREIARVADAADRVVVTKDADFVVDHLASGCPARLLLIAVGNVSNGRLLELFERHLGLIVEAIDNAALAELHEDRVISRAR